VAIIDFTKESPVGPPPSSRIAASEVKAEMQRAGYVLATEHGFLPNSTSWCSGRASEPRGR